MRQFFSFGVVGVINTAIGYSSFAMLYKLLEINYLIAATLAYSIGLSFGYYLNSTFTFKVKYTKSRYLCYFVINIFLLVLGLGILYIFKTKFGVEPLITQILVISIRYPLGYNLNKTFTFS